MRQLMCRDTYAQKRIIEAERAVEAERPQDHFKLLGLKETCSDGDVRSAYKKAALLLHPDRALSKCGGRVGDARGMQCLAKWVAAGWEERARELSDWLFKCLGEAHECLMDASARASFERKHRDARGDDYTRPRPQRR